MIIGSFENISSFNEHGELIMKSLEWASCNYKEALEDGCIMIADDQVKVNVQTVTLASETPLESHRRFIDIHVPISGPEKLGWASVKTLKDVTEEYDNDRDVGFFGDAPQEFAVINPGEFAIFYPDDAHAPNMGEDGKNHRKMCIKIPV